MLKIDRNIDRCGYNVTDKLYKIWEIELNMAKQLLDICEKNEIQIIGFAGTLLGAVRHKGFIPWDDDMDFAMTRENFEKLKAVSNQFASPLFLQTSLSDRRYFLDYVRLRNSETTGIITWNKLSEYNNGIFIDIFVLDGITKSKYKLKKQLFQRSVMRNIIRAYDMSHVLDCDVGFKKAVFYMAHIISKAHPYEEWVSKYDKLLQRYSNNENEIGLMTHDKDFISKYHCKQQFLKDIIYVPFESILIPIPKDYDRLLKNFYGNYKEFPPLEQRGAWHENMIIFDPDVPYKEYIKEHEL